jgi:hypothetical protein
VPPTVNLKVIEPCSKCIYWQMCAFRKLWYA